MSRRLGLKTDYHEFIAVLIAAAAIFFFSAREIGTIHMPYILDDEFGYWGVAAYFTGIDWSGLVSTIPYYSYGYSILLTPLFWIFDDATRMYDGVIIMNSLMNCCSFILCYSIAKRVAPDQHKVLLLAVSWLLTLYPAISIYANMAWGECLLVLLFWLMIWFVIRLDSQTKLYMFFLLGVLSCYIYAVHQRSIGVLFAAFFTVTIMRFVNRISMKQYGVFILAFVAAFMIHIMVKETLLTQLWLNQTGNLTNDYMSQKDKVLQILTVDGFLLFCREAIGQLFYLAVTSFLIFFIGFGEAFRRTFSYVRMIALRGRPRELEAGGHSLAYLFIFISAILTILVSVIFMINPVRMDQLVYGRYNVMIVGPVILIGFLKVIGTRKFTNGFIIKYMVLFTTALAIMSIVLSQAELIKACLQNCVGLIPNNLIVGLLIPGVLTLILFFLMVQWFPGAGNGRRMTLWFMMALLVFYLSGEVALQQVISTSQSRNEIIKVTDYLAEYSELESVYFLKPQAWTDYDIPLNSKYKLDQYSAEAYQFLLQDIPVSLVDLAEIKLIREEKIYLIVSNTQDPESLPNEFRRKMETEETYLYEAHY